MNNFHSGAARVDGVKQSSSHVDVCDNDDINDCETDTQTCSSEQTQNTSRQGESLTQDNNSVDTVVIAFMRQR